MAPRRRSRSRSTARSPSNKSPARANRISSRRNSLYKKTESFCKAIAFYIGTLPESYKSRRELFLPFKCFAIMSFLSFGCAMLGYENPGVRFLAGILAFVSIWVFYGAIFYAPKVLAKAASQEKTYTHGDATHKTKSMSKMYVAHTGYTTMDGSSIYGVYAHSFIPAG